MLGRHTTAYGEAGQRKLGPNGAHSWECQDGTCSKKHPVNAECTGVLQLDDAEELVTPLELKPDLAQLWNELRDAEGEYLNALVLRFPQFVRVNEERGAVRVVGCSGELIAHLPLTKAQLDALD